jgi:hypothetical protein
MTVLDVVFATSPGGTFSEPSTCHRGRRLSHRPCRCPSIWGHAAGLAASGDGPFDAGHVPAVVHFRPCPPARGCGRRDAAASLGAGAGPGSGRLVIDVDSTICEVEGKHNPRTGLSPAGYRELDAQLRHDRSFALMASELLDARGSRLRPQSPFVRPTEHLRRYHCLLSRNCCKSGESGAAPSPSVTFRRGVLPAVSSATVSNSSAAAKKRRTISRPL